MLVDSGETPGNATIFDGTTLQTSQATSHVRLKDGAQAWFGADSKGKLFSDHVDLQQGSANFSKYPANVNGLTIRSDGAVSVSIHGKSVEVASLVGDVHVFNAEGVNVANLVPGKALNLTPQDAGASAPSSLTGCAVRTNSGLVMTDESSNVTVQLRGGKITPRKRITVTGSMAANATPVKPATQVIDVSSVKEIGGPCKLGTASAAAAGGAAAAAGGAAAAGAAGAAAAGVGVTSAVVGGVAAAAAAGTAAAVSSTANAGTSSIAAGSAPTLYQITGVVNGQTVVVASYLVCGPGEVAGTGGCVSSLPPAVAQTIKNCTSSQSSNESTVTCSGT